MRLGWGLSSPAPDAAQQECCEPGFTLLWMGLFSRFFVQALPCTAEGTVCRVRDTRSLVPRAYGTNRSSSNTSCSRFGGGPETSPCQQRAKRPCGFAYRTPWNSGDASALLRLDAGRADNPAPFFGFLRDQLAELGGRAPGWVPPPGRAARVSS